MFEKEIKHYDSVVSTYQREVVWPMGQQQYREHAEVMLSCHSCGIEGSTFTVDDTRALFEQGLGYRPVGKSLLECQEMSDHFAVYEWMVANLNHPFDVKLSRRSTALSRCIRLPTKLLTLYPENSPRSIWQPVTLCSVTMKCLSSVCLSSCRRRRVRWLSARFTP